MSAKAAAAANKNPTVDNMSLYLLREAPPARYGELARFLPSVAERAHALRVSAPLIRAVDDHRPHSARALPAARVNLIASTLAELESRLGSAEAAGHYLLQDGHLTLLLRNGGRSHRASILAAV